MMPPAIYLAKGGATNPTPIPADAVTRTFGIFGVKDSGKTTTARALAEGIVKLGGHAVVLDPVGVWWGITRAGEGPGLPGIVIGGEHGDVPLEKTGGHLVAEVILARQYPVVVVDMKLMRKGEQIAFMADLTEEVYFRNRRPLHILFEEADRALPQNPRGMDPTLGRLLGAAEDIVKLGRSRGLGSSFISQRMATVTKNVTEQVEALLLHAQVGPRDRKAVKEWVEANGDPSTTKVVMDSMASLDVGEAWLYSPKWIKTLERIKVKRPKTLDSSSTPTDDERDREEAAPRAPVDLDELRVLMAESVQRAAENDPKALRAQIEKLKQELEAARNGEGEDAYRLAHERVAELEREVERLTLLGQAGREIHNALASLRGDAQQLARLAEKFVDLTQKSVGDFVDEPDEVPVTPAPADPPRASVPAASAQEISPEMNGDLSAGARSLVDGLLRFYPLWLDRGQLALLLQRGKRSSTLTQQLAEATQAGELETSNGRYRVSANGDDVPRLPPNVAELRGCYRQALPDGPRAVFDVLVQEWEHGGRQIARPDLYEAAGFSATSSTPVGHLKILVDNGLAEKVAGGVQLGAAAR